jgi:DNA-directed RNA polymerase specialized sigma24 family protein
LVGALEEAMPTLPSPQPAVLRLHYFENRRLDEILMMLKLRNYMHVRTEHQKGLKTLALRLRARGVTRELLAEANWEGGRAQRNAQVEGRPW